MYGRITLVFFFFLYTRTRNEIIITLLIWI